MKDNKKPFDGLYIGIEEVKDAAGRLLNTVVYSKNGSYSVIFEIINPVQQYCTDADQYYVYMDILLNIVQTIGEGYALQKQDVFFTNNYHHDYDEQTPFLSRCYFKYYEGRSYKDIRTFLIISSEPVKGKFVKYDPHKWEDFHKKTEKVENILQERGVPSHQLGKEEIREYLHRYVALSFQEGAFSMSSFKASDEHLRMGDSVVKNISLVDIDHINMPNMVKPYQPMSVNGFNIATDLFSFLPSVACECIVYNQVIQVPAQRQLVRKMSAKARRHEALPDPSNKLAKADIDEVLNKLTVDSNLLVNVNFNIIVKTNSDNTSAVHSYIETKLYECGFTPSQTAYNQLELFQASAPGNAYLLNPDYDLFTVIDEAALCMFFKEHLKKSEDSPLEVYYTDRQGVPIVIDITGKEGAVKLTDNANFFCIGPSGSGKSFHMNTVVRQLREQDTDIVMVDTGDSYEGICNYFHGTYITYSKEKPISMNPFKITEQEYTQNFGEKKGFLKSLIFLIYKGDKEPEKIEDSIINQVIVEYYEEYFHPFYKYSDKERAELRERLLLEDKMNGEYDKYEERIEDQYNQQVGMEAIEYDETSNNDELMFTEEEKKHHAKVKRQVEKLHQLVNDKAATIGEKDAANKQLMRLTPELMEKKYMVKIERRIDAMEKKKSSIKVTKLNFNSFYEFALQRIPQITKEKHIDFEIHDFAALLGQFYKGGELEYTLNNDVDASLFDEQFIVFEIDKIKDDPLLFPIVVLIIMDVFIQKMRIKKGRKALIIEEAWKAISSPTMAEYIKYLYKTVRKFNGIAGVVTQELNDVIDSPIVKEAIINNSDVKILLDQAKFKDRYDDIAAILGLTDVQRQQIFTINSLDNHNNRNYFKEVWICRGQYSDVYGVEEPPECYMAYTTERVEKEALKIYLKHYDNDFEKAISQFCSDMQSLKIFKYIEFARLVNKQQKIMQLWDK